jgi:hypothetical protein
MWTDIVFASVLVLMALWGAWKGFVRQLFSLGAVVAVIVFALPAAAKLTELVAEGRDWGPGTVKGVRIAAIVVAAIAINLGVNLVGRWVDRIAGRKRFEEGARMASWNRSWGAALGVVKAALACWLVMCFFGAFDETIPAVNRDFEGSWAARTTGLFNPFVYWFDKEQRQGFGGTLKELWELRKHPDKWQHVETDESVQKVMGNDRLRALAKDSETTVVDLLKDEKFRESLKGVDWGAVRDAIAEARKKEGGGE